MSAGTHFIADLHLDNDCEPAASRLAAYLAGPARQADALYVLGDLFEVWIGDDGSISNHRQTLQAFADLAAAGVPAYFMRGNRDFAVGDEFQRLSRMSVLDDPSVIDLYGQAVLLTHGDLLCSDDLPQQRFRACYTNPRWRARMLKLPLWLRKLAARIARNRSTAGKTHKATRMMDVNADTAAALAARHGVSTIIHGHTHRPADHVDARLARYVIADWRPEQAEVLIVSPAGFQRQIITKTGRLLGGDALAAETEGSAHTESTAVRK
ncbi:MAG: UDP-2,3-diacylglucosamine diphosphatase [Salinisphaera sp.]|jgi:UDP-2,3-diacylglucosamine hydrolase|nr:UDP-2,3-diacylglucosamine diphosphatase [Salinisphaera sp.]